jgi:hypothetical protein
MTVNLTGVAADVQQIMVTLTNVTGSGGQLLGSAAVSLNLLNGDAIASKLVDRADVTLVKGQVGTPVSAVNFREDLDVNGRITHGDVAIAKTDLGHSLP